MAEYELWLSTDTGTRLASLNNNVGFSYARVCNTIGAFSIILPPDFDINLIRVDRMVEIWRAVAGLAPRLDFIGFVRRWEYATDANGRETLGISGPDMNDILRRRIVDTSLGTTTYSDYADDLCKYMADSQMVAVVDSSRAYSALSIQADLSDAPNVTVACIDRNAYELAREIAAASYAAGTRLYFDVVPLTTTTFQFQTWTGQRGIDRTMATGLGAPQFGIEYGNLENPRLEYDYMQEANHITVLPSRYTTGDTARQKASTWNRCEATAVASNPDARVDVGYAALAAGRPARRFSGRLRDTEGCKYGRDWGFGDRVTCTYKNMQFDGVIQSVIIAMDGDNTESIDVRIEVID